MLPCDEVTGALVLCCVSVLRVAGDRATGRRGVVDFFFVEERVLEEDFDLDEDERFEEDFRAEDLRAEADFFLERGGTLAPFLRASESPIASACLRLRTVFPLRPLFSLPRFIFFIACSTDCFDFRPY